MKIRNDFVTNSSSSSFVIAYKNVDNNKLLNEVISAIGNSFEITSKEELDKYYISEYEVGECNTLEKILKNSNNVNINYQQNLKLFNDGFKIYAGYVDLGHEEIIYNLKNINNENLNVKLELG